MPATILDPDKLNMARFEKTLLMMQKCTHTGYALDVGCGENPYVFLRHISNYVGIDIDVSLLKRVNQDLPASLICASSSHLPFRNGTFDLVICTEVLEHLENPKKAVSEIGRSLINGGVVIVSVPSLSLPQLIILGLANKTGRISQKPYQSPDHLREYARFQVTPHFERTSDLFELFRHEGLEIREVASVQLLYTSPKKIYRVFFSRIESLFEKTFSKRLIGHYTIFKAEKRQCHV